MLNRYKQILFGFYIFIHLFLQGCNYGVNEKTSEIGVLNSTCLNDSAWVELTSIYSADSIKSEKFKNGLESVKNHFIKPEYILYFPSGPEEIIGCDWYTVRVAYSPEISTRTLHGLSIGLSDEEQVRIRNRIQRLLMQYQCEKGKKESLEWMESPAPFAE